MIKLLPKNILIILVAMLFFVSTPCSAANFLFSSTYIKLEEKGSFRVIFSVDPGDEKGYITKLELSYPTDLFEVISFDFSDNWMPVNTSGYDLIDNNNGRMVKTAGIPGGISKETVFGEAYFRVKKEGSGVISTAGRPMVLNALNKNILSNAPRINVDVKESSEDEEVDEEDDSSADVPKKIPKNYVFKRTISENDKNNEVVYLQLCLRIQGFYLGDISGVNDDLTQKAVARFQKYYTEDVLKPQNLKEGTGNIGQESLSKLNEICFSPLKEGARVVDGVEIEPLEEDEYANIPEHLFDIKLELNNRLLKDISELSARVFFVNFGRTPTPIYLVFIVADEDGNKVIEEREHLIVETEEALTKKFSDSNLEPGKYSLVLKTLYNTDVEDEFEGSFAILEEEEEGVGDFLWSLGIFGLALAFIVFVIFIIRIIMSRNKKESRIREFFKRRKKKKKWDKLKKKVLKK